ncbi:branched-chain amino acid ABC transporter permease [Rhodococcus opacus]|nr:branched-chain amino acid ABC transporter permease [Rhodococcus opacus]
MPQAGPFNEEESSVMDVVQFAILGLGISAVFTLLAQGVVLVYRTSGLLNFAHGALAMVGAYTFYELNMMRGVPYPLAVLAAMVVPAVVGAVFYWLVLRRLKHASPIVRIVATLGLLTVLQSIATMRYEGEIKRVPSALPLEPVTIGGVTFGQDRLWLIAIAGVITICLHLLSTRTIWGLASSAVAENQRAAASLGWSADRLSVVSWALGSSLGGLAAVLIIPLTGLMVTNLTMLIIPALAVALLAGFRSFPMILFAGIAVGVAQSLATRFVNVTGVPQSVAFLVIVAVLVVRGRSLPMRSHVLERLPALGSGRVNWKLLARLLWPSRS